MQEFLDQVRAAVSSAGGISQADVRLENPRDPALGDVAFPCFLLAKERKAPPPRVAAELAAELAPLLHGIRVTATGPYLNFKIDGAALARSVVEGVLAAGARYGDTEEGRGKTVVVDFSSPNIAKPMSVGHLRSTVIGAAIQRIFDALGYTTVGINHIGDWGSQFGKLVAAVDRWGATVDLEADPIKALLALYVRYHEEEPNDPSLAEAARKAFQELESGVDGHVRATWTKLTRLSMVEFGKIYDRLGVTFDEVRGESYYESHLESAIQRVIDAGITELSDGALVVNLDEFGKLPPCLLRKTDGTTLYATRDLAAAFHREELYHFERCLYVVGADQRLHFRQLKHVLARMKLAFEPRIEHVDFGMMRLPEGKMSTRKGQVVFLEDVLNEAVAKAREVIAQKNPELAEADEIAEAVGVGAVVFNDLKRERVKDVDFVWEEVLSFEGDTGPYVQYTHARIASMARKAEASGDAGIDATPDWSALADSGPLVLRLARFPEAIAKAAKDAEPSVITQALLGLAREANSWIAANRVLDQAPPVTAARLALMKATKTVLAKGLGLLGVTAPEEM